MTINMESSGALMDTSLREAIDRNSHERELCEEYKQDLQMAGRNLQSFQNKMRIDVMVPIGPHALMPGHLYHTNEVLVAKPSGIFIEATTKQALDIVQRRMKVADKRLQDLSVEADFYRSKLEYPQQKGVFSSEGQKEIIEDFDEEAEKKWRAEHRQKVREAKLAEREQRDKQVPQEDFQSLMESLEELELVEELGEEFDLIADPAPMDLSGQVEFKEKPRISYELESFTNTEETVAKSKSSEKPICSPSVEISSDSQNIAPTTEQKEKPKKQRKSLQFCDDLEKVKLIYKTDRPSTLITTYDPDLTTELKFRHSPVDFVPPKYDPDEIKSPSDIYKKFAHCMKHCPSPTSPGDQPKSILKKIPSAAKQVSKTPAIKFQEPEHFEVSHSSTNIYENVVGDVSERRTGTALTETQGLATQNKGVPKRVSRFKAMRS